MPPFPDTNRVYSSDSLVIRSAPIAAYLQLSGHPIVGVRFDREQHRPMWYFETTARADFERLTRAIETVKADAERAGARR
jgi:hypothetical protein